mgnify:FL=1
MPEPEYTDFADLADYIKLFPTLRRGITVHNPSELLSSLWEPSGGAACGRLRHSSPHGARRRGTLRTGPLRCLRGVGLVGLGATGRISGAVGASVVLIFWRRDEAV